MTNKAIEHAKEIFGEDLALGWDEIIRRLQRRWGEGQREWKGYRILQLRNWARYLKTGGTERLEVFVYQTQTA